jgi:hypothetical protein
MTTLATRIIKQKTKELASFILDNLGEHRSYTDQDLNDATHIFQEVFLAKMFDKYKEKLTQEQLETLAEEYGQSLRQTVELFTGVRLGDVYKHPKKQII